jgi:hypothetical protein
MKTTALLAVTLGLAILGNPLAYADDTVAAPVDPAVAAVDNMTDTTAVVDTAAVDAPDATSTDEETVGKLKIQNIRVEDRYGAIEEDRVQAMRSEVRYVPTGSAEGYNLVESSGSQGKSQNAHQASDMKISSWKLFSW